ncbi:MAG TPA: diacylglycerol kinase [Armatimonadota bacterium]|nr:diacylglycerol kinase [Armatimonadota bacterium]
MKSRSLFDSFRFALDGLVHVIGTHRHMRYHLVATMAVLALSVLLRVTKIEVIALILVIAMVLLAELFNTAIEVTVDLVTDSYHPLAKIAKDVAGAAMLLATLTAATVGALIFLDRRSVRQLTAGAVLHHRPANILHVLLAGAVLIMILVAVTKIRGGKGTLMRGGVVSAHAALAAFLATAVYYVCPHVVAVGAAVTLTLLVCQSRVEAGIHTLREVIVGAVGAVAVTVFIFQVLGAQR